MMRPLVVSLLIASLCGLVASQGSAGPLVQKKYCLPHCSYIEKCIDGKCVEIHGNCWPKCGKYEKCVHSECVPIKTRAPCGKRCFPWEICNAKTRRCEERRQTCWPRCRRGQICYFGVCRRFRDNNCWRPCNALQRCFRGRCISAFMTRRVISF